MQGWSCLKFSLKSHLKIYNEIGQVVLEREGGNGSKFMCCLNKKNDNNKKKIKKKIAEIFIKVPDIEWKTTEGKVRPPASNENPAVDGP